MVSGTPFIHYSVILTSVLNLFFHASNMFVVGRFVGPTALAAVGAATTTTDCLFHLYAGLSTAINIMIAQSLGTRDERLTAKILHTAAGASLLLGGIIAVFGLCLSKPILTLLGTPPEVLPHATLYLRIFCLSIPEVLLIFLRCVGQRRHHCLYYSHHSRNTNI